MLVTGKAGVTRVQSTRNTFWCKRFIGFPHPKLNYTTWAVKFFYEQKLEEESSLTWNK